LFSSIVGSPVNPGCVLTGVTGAFGVGLSGMFGLLSVGSPGSPSLSGSVLFVVATGLVLTGFELAGVTPEACW